MSEIADILDKAADLIEPEGAWTQGAYARTSHGYCVGPNEPAAVCFCVRGAIFRAGPTFSLARDAERFAASEIVRSADVGVLALWNDRKRRSQKTVVAKLREAAAKAREQSA